MDEDGVHDSFNQLIAEQSQNGGLDAFELQEIQRELDEEGRGFCLFLCTFTLLCVVIIWF